MVALLMEIEDFEAENPRYGTLAHWAGSIREALTSRGLPEPRMIRMRKFSDAPLCWMGPARASPG